MVQAIPRRVGYFLLVWAIEGLSLALLAWLLPGVLFLDHSSGDTLAVAMGAALILALVNGSIRPALVLLFLPINVYTVGLFTLALNALMLMLTAWLFPLMEITDFWSALLGGLLLAVVNTLLTGLTTLDDNYSYFGRVVRWLTERQRPADDTSSERGIVMLEIDGLGYKMAARAISEGYLPSLRSLIDDGTHVLSPYDCGLPSQTSSCQAGILFGQNWDIPAFRWFEKENGRVVSSSSFKDAAMMNARYSDGQGLLRGGTAINNHATGDASKTLFVMSAMGPGAEGSRRRGGRDLNLFFVNPYLYPRTIALTLWDVIVELGQAVRQCLRRIRPRINRLHKGYPFVRAATNVMLRDISTFMVINDVIRGVPAVYTTYVGYDEVAHHAGPAAPDAMATLRGLDRQFKRIIDAVRLHAGRPYDIFVLSDHGQSFGFTFAQRYGASLAEYMQGLVGGDVVVASVDATEHGQGQTAAFLRTVQEMPKGRKDTEETASAGREPNPTRAAVLRKASGSLAERAERLEPATGMEAEVLVLASGNLANAYFRLHQRRLTLEELDQAYPGLVAQVVSHPGVGFVVGLGEGDRPTVIGNEGSRDLVTGAVTGKDPLEPYGSTERRARQLLKIAEFQHSGDLIVNSTLFPDGQVAAFEELIGSHGGLGGPQTEPFLLHPSDMPAPVTLDSCDVFPLLNSRRSLAGAAPSPRSTDKPDMQAEMALGIRDWRTWTRNMWRALILRPSVFEEVAEDRRATGPALVLMLLLAAAWAFAGALTDRAGAEMDSLNFVTYMGGWLLFCLVMLLLTQAALRLVRRRDTFGRVFRTLMFAQVPQLLLFLGPVPYAGGPIGVLALLVSLLSGWFALRRGLGLNRAASVGIPLLSVVLLVVVVVLVGAMVQGVALTANELMGRFLGN